MPLPGWLWTILHSPGEATVVDGYTFGTGYCLIPWMGVMAAGYGFGTVMLLDRALVGDRLFQLGTALTLGFIVLACRERLRRSPSLVEQSSPRSATFLSFLNCTKYPPSLLYLLMTLGPAILALAVFDRPLGALAAAGHHLRPGAALLLPAAHPADPRRGRAAGLRALRLVAAGHRGPWEVKPGEIPATYGVSLPVVYLIWIGLRDRNRSIDEAPALPARFRLDAEGRPVPVDAGSGDGTGAGGGQARGRVIHDPDQAGPGTVLVVRNLSPELAPVVGRVAALVAETGSPLAHLAILAREAGVATVVGSPGAVTRFDEGTEVEVDGTSGAVTVVTSSGGVR